MSTISLQELQRDTAALVARAAAGERLLVVSGGRPVAELRPVTDPTQRPFGLCAGTFVVPDYFGAQLPDDVLRGLEGR